MMDVRKILVPVDFSPCSRQALEWASLFGRRFGASIDVLHVWEAPHYAAWAPHYPIALDELRLASFERSSAGHAMKQFLAELEQAGGLRVRGRLEAGEPLKTILRVAEEDEYDLVIMGTHGRTGMSHFLLGSLAEAVVRRAPCPVLTIRVVDQAPRAVGAGETHRTVERHLAGGRS